MSGLGVDPQSWLLVALVAVPLLAGPGLLFTSRPAPWATAVASGELVLAGVSVAAAGPYRVAGPGLELDLPWVPALGLRLHLGLDGISAPLVLLTALLTLVVCWHLMRVRPRNGGGAVAGLLGCLLAVEAAAIAAFMALDLLLFFIAFEAVLIPMWFVVARWGDGGPSGSSGPSGEAVRRDAAMRFILYTGLGSAVMLLGLLLVALTTGTTDVLALTHRAGAGISGPQQTLAAALILLGLAVKAPMWPLHTWLPPAHTVAPTAGSVILAGVLLKLGTYAMVRFVVPVLPHGFATLAPWLAAFGVFGTLWAGLVCLVETDLKRLIAMSSVAHLGFVLLGIASMTPTGLQGALYANVAHGVITALLFLVAGALKDRHGGAGDLTRLGGGLRDRFPRLGWLLAFGAVAGLGLPGLAGFWGEFLAIAGAWQSGTGQSGTGQLGALGRPLAVLAALGTLLAAAYLLRVLYLLWHGPCGPELPAGPEPSLELAVPTAADATGHELAVAAPLVLAILALGLMPWLLLDLTGPAVRDLLVLVGGR